MFQKARFNRQHIIKKADDFQLESHPPFYVQNHVAMNFN